MAKRLGDNPLFQQQGSFDAEKEREALGITVPEEEKRRGRPKNEELIRDKPAQKGLTADWTRATFVVRKGHLEKLKDYAYTERLTLKEALDKALGAFLDDKNDLLPHRKGGVYHDEINGEKAYTTREVAEILGKSMAVVQKYIREGR